MRIRATDTSPRGIYPWSASAYAASPPGPIITAICLALAGLGLYLWGEWQTGLLERALAGEDSLGIRALATIIVLLAYLPLAHLLLLRWTEEDFARLRADLGMGLAEPSPPSLLAGIVGAASFIVLFLLLPMIAAGIPDWTFQLVVATVGGSMLGWLTGRFLTVMVSDASRLSAFADQLDDIDLLQLSRYEPFVRHGLRCMLLIVIMLSVTSHLYLNPGQAAIGSTITVLILVGFPLVTFLLPALGIHRRIREAKQQRLELIRERLEKSTAAFLAKEHGSQTELQTLLELEQRTAQTREWPYDASTWFRFILFALLGLASWIGAAAVEQLLEHLL